MGAGLAPGTVVDNRYTIKRLLGKGGMGSVYLARQHSMDRDVAVKIMHHRADSNHSSIQRFFWEVRAARRLQSPHTISVFDFGQTERASLYLAMELLHGVTLAHRLSVEHRIKPDTALRVGVQICRSLEEAHGKNIIHRDLKPENIFLVERDTERDFVKVLDFGVAKFLDPDGTSQLTQTGTVFGTPRYMSPEQANSEPVDARSDLYALGIILYEMLTGKVPFNDDNALELLYKQVHARPTPLVEAVTWTRIDPALGEVVDALLEKRRDDRPHSAPMVREALEEILARLPLETGADMPPPVPAGTPPQPSGARIKRDVAETQQAVGLRMVPRRRQTPTPSMGTRRQPERLVEPSLAGRRVASEAGRRALEEALDRAQSRFIWIVGEPGVGKGRMAAWLAEAAKLDLGAVVARAQGAGSRAEGLPEIRTAIEDLLGVPLLERAELRTALVGHPALSGQVDADFIEGLTEFLRPALSEGRSPAGTTYEALFPALHRLLVRVSQMEPILLDVGTLSDASTGTMRFLEHVAAALPNTEARLCIIGRLDTTRRDADHVLSRVLERVGWQGEPRPDLFEVLSLKRLEGDDFQAFLSSLGKVYINLVDYLQYLSGGNPGIAAKLIHQIEKDHNRLHMARLWNPVSHRTRLDDLPEELVAGAERLLNSALASLTQTRAAREILRRAALIGYSFEVGFLEELLESEGAEILLDATEEVLEGLIRTGCLREVDGGARLRFDTGLARELVLARIRSRRTLKKLHALVAKAIEAMPAADRASRSLELASHHEAAGALDEALAYRLKCARECGARTDTEESLQAYTAADTTAKALLRQQPASESAAAAQHEIVIALARIHAELGLYAQAADSFRELCARAERAEDEPSLAEAERGLAEVQDALAEYGAAAELFERARGRYEALERPLDAAWCDLRHASSLERRGNLKAAQAGYARARQVFLRLNDLRGLAESFNALGMLALSQGDASEALRQLRRAVDTYMKLGDRLDLGKALYHLALAASERRDLLVALDAANKALEIFDHEDYRTGISQCLGTIARVLVTQRRPAEARPYFERALRIREDLGDRRGVAEAVANLADISLALGQPERALELAFRARDIFGTCGEFLGAANALRTMGRAQSELGRHDSALAFLREAVATYESLATQDEDLCQILESLAEAEQAVGLAREAKASLERALTVAHELGLGHQRSHLEARLRAMA